MAPTLVPPPSDAVEVTLVPPSVELPAPATRPVEDLSGDKLLRDAPRLRVAGRVAPSLGGIPLLAKLGQGGMGVVYYGIQPRLGQEVAVKVLPFHLADQNPELVQRFYREARLAVPIQSPHLVRVLDVNEDHGLVFMVLEYVNGLSVGAHLKELRRQGRVLEEAVALDLCLAAVKGLVVAHARGIVHRDIKPDNILIPRGLKGELLYREAKLADLGLARSLETAGESLTASSVALGTPGYLAPEQGMNAKTAGAPADVFSLGASLYAMLCHLPPFRASSVMATLLETAQTPHVPVSSRRQDVSPDSAALIDKCLAKDPAARYADAQELLAALTACRAKLPEPPAPSKPLALPPPADGKDYSPFPASPDRPAVSPAPVPAATPPRPSATPLADSPPPTRPKSRAGAAIAGVLVFAVLAAVGWSFLGSQPGGVPVTPPKNTAVKKQPAAHEIAGTETARPDPKVKAAEALTSALPIALNHKMTRRWPKVLETLEKALADLGDGAHPNKEDALEWVAEARRELEKQKRYRERLEAGEGFVAQGEWEKARTEFQEAGPLWPDAPDAPRVKNGLAKAAQGLTARSFDEHLKRAREATERTDWAGAALSFAAALQAKPDDPAARLGLAEARYQEDLAKGKTALTNREWDAAQQAFERILKERADDAEARNGLADTRFGRRLEAAQRLIGERSYAAALPELGRLLQERPADSSAQAALSKANLGVACEAARLAAKNASWATAAAEWRKALAEDPNLGEAGKGLALMQAMAAGEAAVEKRDWAGAAGQFQKARKEDPDLAAATGGQAYAQALLETQAATGQERWADAEAALRRAEMARSETQAVKDARAELVRLRAAKEQAAKAEPPKDTAAEQRYAQAMTEAQGALAQQDWVKATDAYNRALREKPGDATATQGLSQARAGQQRHDEQFRAALDAAEKALGRDDFDAASRSFQEAARVKPAAKEPAEGLRRVEEARRKKAVRPPPPEPKRGRDDTGVY